MLITVIHQQIRFCAKTAWKLLQSVAQSLRMAQDVSIAWPALVSATLPNTKYYSNYHNISIHNIQFAGMRNPNRTARCFLWVFFLRKFFYICLKNESILLYSAVYGLSLSVM